MVKPYMSIKLKDAQHYYLEDETIACTIDLRLEKILKDPIIKVSFKGRSSSHSNNARHHFETIFTTEKEISITKWNNAANLRKMVQIEFSVEVPNGTTIPSYKNVSVCVCARKVNDVHESNDIFFFFSYQKLVGGKRWWKSGIHD